MAPGAEVVVAAVEGVVGGGVLHHLRARIDPNLRQLVLEKDRVVLVAGAAAGEEDRLMPLLHAGRLEELLRLRHGLVRVLGIPRYRAQLVLGERPATTARHAAAVEALALVEQVDRLLPVDAER